MSWIYLIFCVIINIIFPYFGAILGVKMAFRREFNRKKDCVNKDNMYNNGLNLVEVTGINCKSHRIDSTVTGHNPPFSRKDDNK